MEQPPSDDELLRDMTELAGTLCLQGFVSTAQGLSDLIERYRALLQDYEWLQGEKTRLEATVEADNDRRLQE